MPRILARALTEAAIRAAKPDPSKIVKLVDGEGLRVLVRPSGRKVFELRVQRGGKEATETLGEFPDITLAEARRRAAAARSTVDPKTSSTFGSVFDRWMAVRERDLKADYAGDIRQRVDRNVLDEWRERPVRSISRRDVLEVLNRIAARGAHEQARRVRSILEQAFDYAIVHEELDDNPASKSLLRVLPKKPRVEHLAAMPFDGLRALWPAIEAYPGVVSLALRFLILTAARTGEVRGATWSEIEGDVWTVPAERIKAGREHRVPLSPSALAVLAAARPFRRPSDLVFPTPRGDRPLSENGMLFALKGLGQTATVHGFRSTFSTWANDGRHADRDIVEAALAHVVPGVAGAYDRGDRFEARRALMDAWAAALQKAGSQNL